MAKRKLKSKIRKLKREKGLLSTLGEVPEKMSIFGKKSQGFLNKNSKKIVDAFRT
jgi:hypothetical protein